MRYRTAALTDRTWFSRDHTRSQFTARWHQTLDLLERELYYLDAEDVVFEVDVRPDQITNDGRVYAKAVAATPAVVIRFDSRLGKMVYRCDRYDEKPWGNKGGMALWQHNVRAIALTLEALRAAERYGAIDAGQQYTGFKALPAGRAMPASHMTSDEAVKVMTDLTGIEFTGPSDIDLAAYVKAAKRSAHPDGHNGDRTRWNQLEEALSVLGVGR
jgi:hypothetical protein